MPTQSNNQGKETTQGFNHSLTDHRAKVASLKAAASPADVFCKELLIPLQSDTQLPIRVYRPKNVTEPLPTFFYVPGTGFVAWETAFTNVICSHIAEKAHCQVIAIYHRLAPENRFSVGYKDAYRILRAILQTPENFFKIDRHGIALGGYSSGGNLAALMAIQAKKAKLPIRYQALISPIVDLSRSLTHIGKYKHLETFQDKDIAVTEEFVRWVIKLYLPDDIDPSNPSISPFWQSNASIKGLPPTDIIYGEFDRCRSDAEAYGEKLKAEHVSVNSLMFNGEDHSFLWYKMEVIETIANRLKYVFGNHSIPRPLSQDKHQILFIKAKALTLSAGNEDQALALLPQSKL